MTNFTLADQKAIAAGDSAYLLHKGAEHYTCEDYETALKFYQLSAALGCEQALSNIGYCYLYGRNVEQDVPLAIAYFEAAAKKNCIDAIYKLGNIYSNDKFVAKDEEAMLYYYRHALSLLFESNMFDFAIEDESEYWRHECLSRYPSLALGVADWLINNKTSKISMRRAMIFLKHAEQGYVNAIEDGAKFYEENLEKTRTLIACDALAEIRAEDEAEEAKTETEGVEE